MRAERVYDIAWDIREELKRNKIVALLERLETALTNQSSTPNPAYEQEIIAARAEIAAALEDSKIEQYPPGLFETIKNMKISFMFGQRLHRRIEGILTANQVTPAKALEEIQKQKTFLQNLQKHATNAVAALRYFEIESDDLEPGQFELMIVIPGRAIDDELGQLGKEATRLNQLIGVFSEIATGSRDPVKIRAIASSDPTLFLESPYAVAALIAASIERIAKLYSQIQGIVKTHREMKAQAVPAALIDGMKKHIEDTLKAGIDEVAKIIEKESMKAVETSRKQELRKELRVSLYEIARRLDEGYIFDVNGEDIEDEAVVEGQEPPKVRPEHIAFQVVKEARPNIQHFKAADEPVLGLKRPADDA